MWKQTAAPALARRYPRSCLLAVTEQYVAAVRDMEQVVMIPSLLRDVRLGGPGARAPEDAPDLHAYFTMLKTIRLEVEHGMLPREEWQARVAGGPPGKAEADAAERAEAQGDGGAGLDLEAQFHLHFSSLHHILTHLTLKAQEVARKYREMTDQVL
ncbi:thyroid hormone-inducible hepatic protein [Perognathus longimembris pacificus]|uniref:thyroid hormone-inducible hepatic protein n=1 Tax=Perognathus longimembris pacificus TaxID=214514 RepID=UPI0020195E53|nr:thyroid hormone-inducible hepatic protein [Perognathus longimembris pacificus]